MRASSAPGSTAIARYSEAIATQSSVSAITAGLQAIGSRSTAKPSAVPTSERVEAVEVLEAALERLLERRALAQPPGQVAGSDLGVVLGLELDALARAARSRRRLWFDSEPLCTRQRSRPGRERVRALGRDPALGRHPGVAERVGAGHRREPEALDELRGPHRLLVDLDRAARRSSPSTSGSSPPKRSRRVRLGHGTASSSVARRDRDAAAHAERGSPRESVTAVQSPARAAPNRATACSRPAATGSR